MLADLSEEEGEMDGKTHIPFSISLLFSSWMARILFMMLRLAGADGEELSLARLPKALMLGKTSARLTLEA